VLAEFIQQVEATAVSMRAALQEHEAEKISHLAHNIKGASVTFSAGALTRAASRLELQGRSGDLSNAVNLIECIEAEIPRLKLFLEKQQKG